MTALHSAQVISALDEETTDHVSECILEGQIQNRRAIANRMAAPESLGQREGSRWSQMRLHGGEINTPIVDVVLKFKLNNGSGRSLTVERVIIAC